MKKVILMMFVACVLFGCISDKEKQEEQVMAAITSRLNDLAFKNNAKLEIVKFDLISVDTVSENYIDSAQLDVCQRKISHFLDLTDEQAKAVTNRAQMVRLSSGLSSTLFENSKVEFEKEKKEYSRLMDSITYYSNIDSLKRVDMTNKPKSGTLYKAKTFLKATFTGGEKGESQNILDTIYYVLDQNMKVIENPN